MDIVSRSHYEQCFKIAFMEKKGEEFQYFFASVMEKRYPADFARVRPWGKVGDRKNDGYLKSKRFLFQIYAPLTIVASECIAKIDEDFTDALPHWKQYFDSWIFAHNAMGGLGPDVLKKLLELDDKHAEVNVAHWGFEELRREAMQLHEPELASLFGPAPSRQGLIDLGLQDLVPVLDHIARLPAVSEPDLRPVPADKLQRNMLSDAAAVLLRAGMSRVDLVRKYFKLKPTLQDQIAESFRTRYIELRTTSASPDDVFADLQRFAGGPVVPSPARQNAVLAALAFFFEECDIFERPQSAEAAP
jgi:hypothetical protein